MKTNKGSGAEGLVRRFGRTGILVVAISAAALVLTSCVDSPRPYAGGYYSAGYGYPYGYGYGNPYGGYPYGDPYGYGYGGGSIVISGARYHGYRSPYYRNGYYPRTQVQGRAAGARNAGVISRPRVSGSTSRTSNPRTQATQPQ
jgi:hypothetical protein